MRKLREPKLSLVSSKNKLFDDCLQEMAIIHSRKSKDYSNLVNPYSNFEYAALIAEPFTDPVDKVFAVLFGIKLARIAELRKAGRLVHNETVEDSFKDFATYSTIWWSRYKKITRSQD